MPTYEMPLLAVGVPCGEQSTTLAFRSDTDDPDERKSLRRKFEEILRASTVKMQAGGRTTCQSDTNRVFLFMDTDGSRLYCMFALPHYPDERAYEVLEELAKKVRSVSGLENSAEMSLNEPLRGFLDEFVERHRDPTGQLHGDVGARNSDPRTQRLLDADFQPMGIDRDANSNASSNPLQPPRMRCMTIVLIILLCVAIVVVGLGIFGEIGKKDG
eukprot:TRINITY_DN21228_c0_g1_i1.p1 TRINITY_DN21228_c0_g1~~TRINITY_DN21228_c0_g1_i1.p1  ORF type:complete len:215 (-),score=26.63 TRINITY_DN21228_c0_g1_i1:31-675(-)